VTERQTGPRDRTVWITPAARTMGASWSAPVEITAQVKKPEWTWYATGRAMVSS